MRVTYQISLSPRVRKTPFFARTVQAGLEGYTIYNHMMLPAHFGDHLAEYHSLMNHCCIWDVAAERQVEMVGPDAGKLAQLLCPRDLRTCAVGQGLYVPVVNHQGGMLNDPVLLKLAEDRYWLSIADGDLKLWAQAIAAERGFDVVVDEPDVSPLAIQGPKAMTVAESLFGTWVHDLKYFWFRPAELDGIPVIVARSGWSKQGGIEIYLRDGSMGNALWDRVWAAGQPHQMAVGAPNQYERIESGLLSYGADMDHRHSPYDCGLGRFVTPDAEVDFIGKAALKRIKAEGPRWRHVGLFVEGAPVAYNTGLVPLRSADGSDRPLGNITSMIHSPKLSRNIALAMVEPATAAAGEALIADCQEGPRRATLTAIPFR